MDANTLDPSLPLDDDALIDQRCIRFPRDIYMRLARSQAFPNEKIGKFRVARYGDVKEAFAARAAGKAPPTPSTPEPEEDDGLDEIRQQVGFDTKGK